MDKMWIEFRNRFVCFADGDSGGGGVPSSTPSGGAVGGGSTGSGESASPAPTSPSGRSAGPGRISTPKPVQHNVSSTREGSADEAIDFDLFFGTPQPLSLSEKAVAGEQVQPVQSGVQTQPTAVQPPGQQQVVPEAQIPQEVGQQPQTGQQPQAQERGGAPQQQPDAPRMPDYNNPAVLAMEMRRLEPEMMQHVANTVFALSPQDVEALQTDPASIVPHLMSRAFIRSQQNTLELMARLLPAQLAKHTADLRRHSANEDKFYSRWKEIDKGRYGDIVMKYAAVYRQMNPHTPLDQMIEDLGPLIMMAARIVPQHMRQGGGNGQHGNPLPSGARPAPAFVPALGGPSGAASQQEASPWDVLDPNIHRR